MKFLHEHPDVIKVAILNIASFTVSFTNIETGLKILALCVTIGYGIWKWYTEYKKEQKKRK